MEEKEEKYYRNINGIKKEMTEKEYKDFDESRKPSLSSLKEKKKSIRQNYLNQTFQDWFDDVENMPQEIKKKRILARQQIEQIELCETLNGLNIFNNNF